MPAREWSRPCKLSDSSSATPSCLAHKYLLTLAYKGTTYHGFQAQLQNHAGQQPREFNTVQSVLEKSLKRVREYSCCNSCWLGGILSLSKPYEQVLNSEDRVIISVASRTDAGVHARGQAATFCCKDAHFELQMAALNLTLDRNIAVTDIAHAPDAFNVARSVGKLYSYR